MIEAAQEGVRVRRVAETPQAADEVAHAAGTIAYELLCALARRVPVRVVEALQEARS